MLFHDSDLNEGYEKPRYTRASDSAIITSNESPVGVVTLSSFYAFTRSLALVRIKSFQRKFSK
jgi:hypothetical protein